MTLQDTYTTEQLQTMFGVSNRTLYVWRDDQGFPAPFKIGRRNYWRKADVGKWVEKRARVA